MYGIFVSRCFMSLLPILLLVPLVGAAVCALMPSQSSAKFVALLFSIADLVIGIIAAAMFYAGTSAGALDFSAGGIPELGFAFHLGIDAISLWLVLLTLVLMPLAIAS